MGIVASILRSFHGGVHPKEFKELSEHCAIEAMPIPKRLYVPLHQHIGRPCEPAVTEGLKVLKGEVIGKSAGFVSAPVHAPTSGTVVGFEEHTVGHPSGLTMLCAVLEPDGQEQWCPDLKPVENPMQAEPGVIRGKIRDAGIVGLGGATFPSFIKMSPPKGKVADLLLMNGVECEPYLTCDARLMEERADQVVEGINVMLHALRTKECVIGIEDNKPGAIRVMSKAVENHPAIKVQPLPVMYPQGSEKQLIEVITGRQVPSGGLPVDVGVIVHNVATATAIRDAVVTGRPLVSRVVTVTGRGITRPANVDVLIGTPVQVLLDHCGGLKPGVEKIINGGPMMGVALYNTDVPVVKGTSGILALIKGEFVHQPEMACIRCGHCLEACPISLIPCEMAWQAKNDKFDLLPDLNLFDCIECGSCSYVCPSNIPLVHYFRYGKLAIQSNKRQQQQADLNKARTKAKEARTEKIKAEKEAKKAAMKAKAAANAKAKAAAAAAAPAKLAEQPTPVAEAGDTDAKAARAARVAKAALAAKAARAAKTQTAAGTATAPKAGAAPPTAAPDSGAAFVSEGGAVGDEKAARVAKAALAAKAARAAKAAHAAKVALAAKAASEGATEAEGS